VVERCGAASSDRPFVHLAAFSAGEGRESGTFLPFAAGQNLGETGMVSPWDSGADISVIFCGRGKNGDNRRFHWKETVPQNLVSMQWFSATLTGLGRPGRFSLC
jgi:hypothetical protein